MKAIALHTVAAIALTFAIAGCSSQQQAPEPTPAPDAPPPASSPAPEPAPPPAPPPPATERAPIRELAPSEYDNFLDAPQTPGTWFYEQVPGQTRAVFGPAADDVTFMMFCDAAARDVILVRADSNAVERAALIRTETHRRMISMTPPRPGAGVITTRLSASDPLLDAMAITKGRFAVETAGLPSLYLPAWVEVTRVIEDCR